MLFLRFSLLVTLLFIYILSNAQIRYVDDLPGKVIKQDFAYQTVKLSDCWNNGNKPKPNQLIKYGDPKLYNPSNNYLLVPGSNLNNKCFNYFEFSTLKPEYNYNDSTFELYTRLFSIEQDNEPKKKAIIYIGGGMGFFDSPQVGSGIRFFDKLLNQDFFLKEMDLGICNYLAQKGYAVFYIDFRKGWDIKGISNWPEIKGFETYFFPKYCDCEDSCDIFSFKESYYRNVQDIYALHSKLIQEASNFHIDPNDISYFGNSSGSNIAILATFGRNNLKTQLTSINNNPNGVKVTMEQKLGPLTKFMYPGISEDKIKVSKLFLLSAAIGDTNWIESSDSTFFKNNHKFPVYIAQATDDVSSWECSGISRGVKYFNKIDSAFFVYGGGSIHDRILNIGGESHLISQYKFDHGGPFTYSEIKCFNRLASDTCFNDLSNDAYFKVLSNFVLDYLILKGDSFVHAIQIGEPNKENYNGNECNECYYINIATKDSIQSNKYSCCTQDCGRFYQNIVTGISNYSIDKKNFLKIYPNPIANEFTVEFSTIETDKELYIYEVMGSLVKYMLVNKGQSKIILNSETFPKGILYFVLKNNLEILESGKIVKM